MTTAELVFGFKTKGKLKERDIEALDLTKSKLTSNEFNAASKNYFEEKRLIRKTHELNREAKRAIDLQDKSLELIQNSMKNVFQSTGNCANGTRRLVKSAQPALRGHRLEHRPILYDAFETKTEDYDTSDTDDEKYNHNSNRLMKMRPNSSVVPRSNFYSTSVTLNIQKFTKNRPNTAKPAIETIRNRKNPGLKVTIDSSESDDECLARWNKFKKEKLREQVQNEMNVQFIDEKMEKLYYDLREAREKIPHVNEEKIQEMKLKDPVFAKRYKQYKLAKQINRPPDFDPNDINIKIRIPKSTLEREKAIIMKKIDNEKEFYNKINMEQQRIYSIKVKEFLSKLS
jgi:hypothetical protein